MDSTTENITALTLPDPVEFKAKMQAITQFQRIVREQLIEGQDYGTFPGIDKPTLFKPGAEKIAKLLDLSDVYTVQDKQENWTGNGFFHYLIKAQLIHIGSGKLISEGLGECNSMESKYQYRWLTADKLPPGTDATKLVQKENYNKKSGGHWITFRVDNEDIFSQVNTILKMAKKRALVDAALSAGRLSQLFTQDVEDLVANKVIDAEVVDESTGEVKEQVNTAEHYCQVHKVNFFKKGKMRGYAHKINGTEEWCNEPEQPVAGKDVIEPKKVGNTTEQTPIQRLLMWTLSHGKTYDATWVCKQAGVNNTLEITDFPKTYAILKEITGWTD